MWGEPIQRNRAQPNQQISTHSPRVGRTRAVDCACAAYRISTHSPRVGRTLRHIHKGQALRNFNSLAPCGANRYPKGLASSDVHFNSLAPCGANLERSLMFRGSVNFNSLAPCGANPLQRSRTTTHRKFQLTRPVWGEPRGAFSLAVRPRHFNSLAPCGANRCRRRSRLVSGQFQLTRPVWGEPRSTLDRRVEDLHFNSLAPCGANRTARLAAAHVQPFQLTRPVWGEPIGVGKFVGVFRISTHSPRVGRTLCVQTALEHLEDFNSLAPCGANPLRPNGS